MSFDATETRSFIPALQRIYAPVVPLAYPFIRFCTGVLIARHGYPKIFEGGTAGLSGFLGGKLGLEPALAWAWLIGFVEFGGGILIAIGLLTRLAAAALVVEFAVIVFVIKWANGLFAFAPKAIQPGFPGLSAGGFEFEMLLGLLCLAILVRGGNGLSVDRAVGKEI